MIKHPDLDGILDNVNGKCAHKVRVKQNAASVFGTMKEEARTLVEQVMAERDKEALASVAFREVDNLQFQMDFGEDTVIFNLHEDVFDLEASHPVRKTSYVKEDPNRAFCGMVSIYNFLSTSINKARLEDLGYLIGRIFINADNHFFVDGKKRLGFLYSSFDTQTFNEEAMREVLMASVHHCMESDLEVPAFEAFASLNVMQIQSINGSMGKLPARPLGFHFNKPLNPDE